jgi:two-component system CheB/CheR fusion protein
MRANQGSLLISLPSTFLNLSNRFLPPQTDEFAGEPVFEDQSPRDVQRKGHALVVDDVPDVTDMLSVLLMHAGWEVVTAESASAALAAARQAQFDIIISDIGMPVMNGYELARTLRAQPGYETVPMVAVTGYSMFDDRERSLAAGFNAHLTKPIEPHVLLDLIEHLRN